MIVVKVELHSTITGRVTPLAAMIIANDGTGSKTLGNYIASRLRKGTVTPATKGQVKGHPRLAQSVWVLVAKAIAATAHGRASPIVEEPASAASEEAAQPEDEQ